MIGGQPYDIFDANPLARLLAAPSTGYFFSKKNDMATIQEIKGIQLINGELPETTTIEDYGLESDTFYLLVCVYGRYITFDIPLDFFWDAALEIDPERPEITMDGIRVETIDPFDPERLITETYTNEEYFQDFGNEWDYKKILKSRLPKWNRFIISEEMPCFELGSFKATCNADGTLSVRTCRDYTEELTAEQKQALADYLQSH
jgi:hypothetical protein